MRSVYKVHACVVCTFGVLRKEDDHAITSYNEEKTNKFKDPEFMSSFIDKYTEMRNLWEVKHSLYYNKQDELSQEEGLESGRQKEAVPSDSQEVAMPSGSQEVGGPSDSQEVAGPSRSLTQSQVPPLRLPTKRPRKGTMTEKAAW
ncbi:hypothetical protein AB205_0157780 [Aquarana catesbeiana]|uniref:MADF domain-containing protein n=1 Tax=Aquarana catesbeiana TaxID=8400 RepID=A0A2G9P4Y8_AQUCT|nr:hypothetical protein AB205_0157780 [Aquarana catesbeiana]